MSQEPTVYEGDFNAAGGRFAIVASRFNAFIVEKLVEGALDALRRHGADVSAVDVAWVPGTFEMPLVARRMACSKKYDAVICVGAVIRGGTPHFDYVAGQCARGVSQASWDSDVPVLFGVLTTDSIEQCIERAGTKMGNKGFEAAVAAIETANLLKGLPTGES